MGFNTGKCRVEREVVRAKILAADGKEEGKLQLNTSGYCLQGM